MCVCVVLSPRSTSLPNKKQNAKQNAFPVMALLTGLQPLGGKSLQKPVTVKQFFVSAGPQNELLVGLGEMGVQ